MTRLVASLFAVLLLHHVEGGANCPSLNNPTYGKFDKCAEGNSCPTGTKATLTCPSGFRATSNGVSSCDEVKKPSDALAAALWDKLNGGKPVANWNPILAPTCVADPTHCVVPTLQPLVSVTYTKDKNSCETGACVHGTDASFTCQSGLLCGASTINCQKINDLSSDWTGSAPRCSEEGSSCNAVTSNNIVALGNDFFAKLFGRK